MFFFSVTAKPCTIPYEALSSQAKKKGRTPTNPAERDASLHRSPQDFEGVMDHLNPSTTTQEKRYHPTSKSYCILRKSVPPSPTPSLELHIPTNRRNKSLLQTICTEIHRKERLTSIQRTNTNFTR